MGTASRRPRTAQPNRQPASAYQQRGLLDKWAPVKRSQNGVIQSFSMPGGSGEVWDRCCSQPAQAKVGAHNSMTLG
jgi:hypothetical protein